MLKKTLILIVALLPLCVKAQLGVGSWETFPIYYLPEQLVETPSKVYCLSSGTLLSYDKNTDETYNYGVDNLLSEANISNIYYNPDGKYLVLTYPTGNIDVIYDNGDVRNLTDIKDAVLTTTRSINDVAFMPGRLIVATSFGLVVYDDKKMEVQQTGIYNKNVQHVGATEDYIVIYLPDTKQIGVIDANSRVNLFDNFTFTKFTDACRGLEGLEANRFVLGSSNSNSMSVRPLRVNDNKTVTVNWYADPQMKNLQGFKRAKDFVYLFNGDNFVKIDKNNQLTTFALPALIKNNKVAVWDTTDVVWAADINGIGEYDITDGNVTVLHNKFKGNTLSTSDIGRITITPSGRIYTSHYGHSDVFAADWGGGAGGNDYNNAPKGRINRIDNGVITDVTPAEVSTFWYGVNTSNAKRAPMKHPGKVVEDPDDSDVYYVPMWWDGVCKVRGNEEVVTFGYWNSPVDYVSYTRADQIAIDKNKNLWVLNLGKTHYLHMLPASARTKEIPAKEDWISTFPLDIENCRDASLLPSSTTNKVFFSIWFTHKLYVLDHKGTDTPNDDVRYIWTAVKDQDDKLIDMKNFNISCLTEDKDGNIWVGHQQGIFIINNPDMATNPNMTVYRPKVPRNDGTGYADYLLDGDQIICIAVDNSNRKWISTANSGVYLVSEDGRNIIANYTTDNSSLPVNRVYSIACDPTSNAVYFGTKAGMVKYNSTASPGADNYSDVYAYPNPVRPEYTGWITIKGLMDKSLVKIADAAGNVVFTTTSQGGDITWDGCNSSGERVKTGVYYVFASQNASSNSSAAVTKIMVIN